MILMALYGIYFGMSITHIVRDARCRAAFGRSSSRKSCVTSWMVIGQCYDCQKQLLWTPHKTGYIDAITMVIYIYIYV